jgi:hypothetical protein
MFLAKETLRCDPKDGVSQTGSSKTGPIKDRHSDMRRSLRIG